MLFLVQLGHLCSIKPVIPGGTTLIFLLQSTNRDDDVAPRFQIVCLWEVGACTHSHDDPPRPGRLGPGEFQSENPELWTRCRGRRDSIHPKWTQSQWRTTKKMGWLPPPVSHSVFESIVFVQNRMVGLLVGACTPVTTNLYAGPGRVGFILTSLSSGPSF